MTSNPDAPLTVGGYQLDPIPIGSGGASKVYLGRKAENPDEVVAIKVLDPMTNDPILADEFRKRFLREARVMLQLHHHNILPLLDVGEDPLTKTVYMVMPYIDGGTLADLLARTPGALDLQSVIPYVSAIAEALDYAHAQNIIHRDIKPANVLLSKHGHIYLADFGIVKVYDIGNETQTSINRIIGTPAYMSPEQAKSEPVGPSSDIYSLAVVTYNLVTSNLPFPSANPTKMLIQIATEPPTSPRFFRHDLPRAAEAVILQALNKDPSQRFPSAGAYAAALAQAFTGQWPAGVQGVDEKTREFVTPRTTMGNDPDNDPTQAGGPIRWPTGAQPKPESRSRRRGLSAVIGILAAALLVISAAAFILTHRNGSTTPLIAITTKTAQPTGTQSLTPASSHTPTVKPTATRSPTKTPVPAPKPKPAPPPKPKPTPTGPTPTPPPSGQYFAAVPGPCDSGNAIWSIGSFATYQCLGSLLELNTSPGQYIGQVFFQLPNYSFPSSYAVQVTGYPNTGCAGLNVLVVGAQGYAGFTCNDGTWYFIQYDSGGNPTILNSGSLSPATSSVLKMTVTSAAVAFLINGVTMASATPGYDATQALELVTTGTSEFKNFTYYYSFP